jgi:hypothetical protein
MYPEFLFESTPYLAFYLQIMEKASVGFERAKEAEKELKKEQKRAERAEKEIA